MQEVLMQSTNQTNREDQDSRSIIMSAGNLGSVIVAVDGSQQSMDALTWALQNLKLRSTEPPGFFIILHVQSPPTIAVGLNPGAIPFGGPSDLEVPAFTAAIEAHQKRITDAVIKHALKICSQHNDVFRKCKQLLRQPCTMPCYCSQGQGDALLSINSVLWTWECFGGGITGAAVLCRVWSCSGLCNNLFTSYSVVSHLFYLLLSGS
ncbi:hypothetical protein Ddye_006420 [Dipteronia dyeriana]|uniref:UspA domain-containing protein n=1 Tax=Dipteronia dyeriana TaxID=168575 RepID=A0AAD9XIB8_9ROSI|nr:hypothetical protein Ddye_006420 [Dipteronia dyeriana]